MFDDHTMHVLERLADDLWLPKEELRPQRRRRTIGRMKNKKGDVPRSSAVLCQDGSPSQSDSPGTPLRKGGSLNARSSHSSASTREIFEIRQRRREAQGPGSSSPAHSPVLGRSSSPARAPAHSFRETAAAQMAQLSHSSRDLHRQRSHRQSSRDLHGQVKPPSSCQAGSATLTVGPARPLSS